MLKELTKKTYNKNQSNNQNNLQLPKSIDLLLKNINGMF
jgi:hypothetical protein